MERVTDRNARRPLPIPANPGLAIPVNAPTPSDWVGCEGDFRRGVFYFHPANVATAEDLPAAVDLKRSKILMKIVFGDPVPERQPLDGRG